MHKRPNKMGALLTVCLLAQAPLASAGVIITGVDKDTQSGKVTHNTLYIDGNRMAVHEGNGSGSIFDGDSQTSWNYDIHRKTYIKMTLAQAKAMMAKVMQASKAASKRVLAGMSPAQRKKLKAEEKKTQQMKQKGPHYRVGAKRTVGHWHCTQVTKFSSFGEKLGSACIASYKDLGVSPREFRVFKSAEHFTDAMGGGDDSDNNGDISEKALKRLGVTGFPVQTNDGSTISTTTSIRHGHVSAKKLQLPSGLHQQKMPGM